MEQLSRKYPKAIKLFMHFYDNMDWEQDADHYWSFKDYTEFGFFTQVGIMLRFLEKEYKMIVLPKRSGNGYVVKGSTLPTENIWRAYKEGIDLCFKAIEEAAKDQPTDKPLKIVN